MSGWIPDPPGKDWGFAAGMLSSLTSNEDDVDLQPWCTDVSNQLSLSSCVANAAADAYELCTGLEMAQAEAPMRGMSDAVSGGLTLARLGKAPQQVSRLHIYFNGRARMSDDGIHNRTSLDDGMYVRAAFDAIRVMGVCPEHMWPYKPENVNRRPTVMAEMAGLKNKIHGFYRIDESDPESALANVRSAIRGRHPVVFSIPVFERFQRLSGGVVDPPRREDKIIGYHAIMGVGTSGGNVKMRNSWGTGWADGGYALLHPDWFTLGHARSMFVPTKGIYFR